ncbi:MAG: CBS domain-containing protein [Bdellovibrionales bacterium]|nr:CBS domain-containing protein [Bdellovibrionales bacterium]
MKPTVKAIMTKDLMTIPAGSPVSKAWEIMEERKFRHLPVVNGNEQVIGILSQRDLNFIKNPEVIPVEYIMSAPVMFVDQNTPLRSAIFRMLEGKISSLLIANENQQAVGIVTTDDLLFYLAHLLDENKEQRFSVSSLLDLQTIGEAARQISNAGI